MQKQDLGLSKPFTSHLIYILERSKKIRHRLDRVVNQKMVRLRVTQHLRGSDIEHYINFEWI